jgi:hypothetical protein
MPHIVHDYANSAVAHSIRTHFVDTDNGKVKKPTKLILGC